MATNYIMTHQMHPHRLYMVKLAKSVSLLHNPSATLLQGAEDHLPIKRSEEPAPSAALLGLQYHTNHTINSNYTLVRAHNNNVTSYFHVRLQKIRLVQCWLWSQFSERYVTVVAAEQMLAQQRVWRRSQLAALSAASLTGYISYTGGIKNKPKNVFSLWNDLKMLWGWDK